jgi:hypothetical protein
MSLAMLSTDSLELAKRSRSFSVFNEFICSVFSFASKRNDLFTLSSWLSRCIIDVISSLSFPLLPERWISVLSDYATGGLGPLLIIGSGDALPGLGIMAF